jgi:uncharacterized damage-inducible protein DinB
MPANESLLPEYDREMGLTRLLLECLPNDHLGWKPHERARTLGGLATHLAELPGWSATILDQPSFNLETAGALRREEGSRDAILALFDRNVSAARAAIAARTDAESLARWTFRRDGREIFAMPKAAALRMLLLNHSVYHRGQLSVYLRLLDRPLPPMYGPSSDEVA